MPAIDSQVPHDLLTPTGRTFGSSKPPYSRRRVSPMVRQATVPLSPYFSTLPMGRQAEQATGMEDRSTQPIKDTANNKRSS